MGQTTRKPLNATPSRADPVGMNHAPASSPVLSSWAAFVDRFGVSTVVGMLAAILSLCWVQNLGVKPADGVPGVQLLLVMIILGCIGVLSYRDRQPGVAAATVPVD